MIALGDWLPEEPLQGVSLTRLHSDLYDLRAVGIMSGLAPDDVPAPGVIRYQSSSKVYNATVTASEKQINGFAAYYGGVAIRTLDGWVIKAIAEKMRKDHD
jgi:hypothetical protein